MAAYLGATRGTLSAWMAAAVLAAAAALGDGIPEPLRRCAALENDAERLACYDRYVASGGAETSSGDSDSPGERSGSTGQEADTAASAEARFGLADDEEDEKLDEITATITDIVVRANRERIFTLDNGQVWVEDAPMPSLRLDVGDKVTISSGLFGSYRLRGSSRRSTAVDRAR